MVRVGTKIVCDGQVFTVSKMYNDHVWRLERGGGNCECILLKRTQVA